MNHLIIALALHLHTRTYLYSKKREFRNKGKTSAKHIFYGDRGYSDLVLHVSQWALNI